MRFSGACAILALATAAHGSMLPTPDGAAAPAGDSPAAAGASTTAPAAPVAQATAAAAAPATFEQRIDRMLSAALLADLFPFTRDPDISDEGYEAAMALALQCARLAPERRAGWDLVILLADQVEGGTPDAARAARRESLAALANQLGGNVGIGTNNPSALLSIYSGPSNTVALSVTSSGTGLGSGMRFINTTPSTGRSYGIYSSSDGLLYLTDATAAADRMTIGSTGVTILNNLSLTGASAVFYKYGPTAGYYMDMQGGSATNSPMIEFFAGATRRSYIGNASSTSMEIYCQNGANLNFLTEGSNRMMIATSGNVGINTITPATPLDVNGNVRAITGFGTNTGSLVGLTQTVTPIHVFRGMMALLTVTGSIMPSGPTITYVGFVQWVSNVTSPTINNIVSNGIAASIVGILTPTVSLATTAAVTANVTWNMMYITCPVYASANTFTPGF